VDAGVGAAVSFCETRRIPKLPDFCLIYTAEALAIPHALYIIKQESINKSIILSDSLSALTSIKNHFQPNSISQKNSEPDIISSNQRTDYLHDMDTIGIPENELADTYYICQTVHLISSLSNHQLTHTTSLKTLHC